MELAARRRSYELANILKRRRAEENAVWSWWMVRFFPYEKTTRSWLMPKTACTRRIADHHGRRDEQKAPKARTRSARFGKAATA